MLDHILAKYSKDKITGREEKETLVEHTMYVLKNLEVLKSRTHGLSNEFWENTFIMCLFHDSGKISENFKEVLNGNYKENVRHEMLSGAFLLYFYKRFLRENSCFPTAIYSHHKRLNEDIFDEDQFKTLTLTAKNIKEWFQFAEKVLSKHTIAFQALSENNVQKLATFNAIDYRLKIFQPFYDLNKNRWKTEDRLQYIYAKAVLNISDWSASGHFKLADTLKNFTEKSLQKSIEKKLVAEGKLKGSGSIEFREFQRKSKVKNNVLAIAPTGSGKTEASLVWASQKEDFDKIIYCLPTRVTSNAIYERLSGYFDKSNCSVVHSSALLYQKEIDDNYDGRKYLRDRAFFSNITVCTIDQILTQGFNLGFWEVKSFHCRNAWIIIDEIHLYQPYTLALILRSIEYLRINLNAHFYIMSATMPSKLRNLLTKSLGGNESYQLIKDTELLGRARNIFEIRNQQIQENINEIRNAISTYPKVLVVVNTVDQAIDLYSELKEAGEKRGKICICFHSRFIQKDRHEKEQKILKAEKNDTPILLIATQVVEVSLDIDFDILFTENAPIDALIQRAGRVNRKGDDSKKSKVIVHLHSETSKKNVYTEEDILEKTLKVLKEKKGSKITESEFLKMVDQVYEDIDITEKGSFIDGWNAYDQVQRNHHYLGDSSLSDEYVMTRELDSKNVIPWQFYEELKEKTKWEKAKYELSIRKWRFQEVKKIQEDGFNYINYPYNSKIGMTFPKNESQNNPNKARSY